MTDLKVSDRVVINVPTNPKLHDTHATVKEVCPCGYYSWQGDVRGHWIPKEGHFYLLDAPAAATKEFRALPHEVHILRDGGILDVNTTGTTYEAATQSGFTGNACTKCEGIRMVRNGACLLCLDCGESSGCS